MIHPLHIPHRISELNEVYISSGLFHFVSSLTGLFIPLYFMNVIGYSLAQVFIFLALIALMRAGFAYPVGLLISKIGPKHTMIAAFPLAFLIYLFLYLLPQNTYLITPIMILEALVISLYGAGFHVNLSKGSHDSDRGKEISRLAIVNIFSLAAGPAAGGIIIAKYGFPALLVIAMVVLVFASIPLLMSPEIYKKRPFSLKNLNIKTIWQDMLGNASVNVEIVSGVTIWAIFVFLFAKTYEIVGAARTLQLLVAGVMTYIIGRVADKYDRKKMLNFGAPIAGVIEFARIFARTVPTILAVDFIRGIFLPLKTVPFISLYYKHADEQPRMEYVFAMEASAAFGILVVMVVLLGINIYLGDFASLIAGLIAGGVAAFGIRFIRKAGPPQ